jgi:vacuolar-type H+-ATPase catalytic subunit A/Vma1
MTAELQEATAALREHLAGRLEEGLIEAGSPTYAGKPLTAGYRRIGSQA